MKETCNVSYEGQIHSLLVSKVITDNLRFLLGSPESSRIILKHGLRTFLPKKHGSFEIEKNGTYEADMLANFDEGSRTPLITASSTELPQISSFRGKGVQNVQKLTHFTSSIKNQGPVVLKQFGIVESFTNSPIQESQLYPQVLILKLLRSRQTLTTLCKSYRCMLTTLFH